MSTLFYPVSFYSSINRQSDRQSNRQPNRQSNRQSQISIDLLVRTFHAPMLSIRAQTVCPADPPNPDQAQLLPSGLSTHRVLQIIAVVSTTITGVLACGLILMHLLRFRIPDEQRQIIRLVAVPLIYAVISLLQIYFYDAADYLRPIADLYEAFAVAFLLMLFVHFAEPGLKSQGDAYSRRLYKVCCLLTMCAHMLTMRSRMSGSSSFNTLRSDSSLS